MIRAFVIAIVMAFLVPGIAWAKPKVAIVPFDDDSSGELQDVVAELLEDDFSVVGPRQTTRALDKLGYDSDLTSKKMKKVAKELEVEAIVRGEVSKKKSGHKLLHIKLFVNNKKARGFKVEFGSARSAKFKEALKEKLLERLAAVSGGGGDEDKPKKKEPKGDEGDGDKGDKDKGDKDKGDKDKGDKDKGDKGDGDKGDDADKQALKTKKDKDDNKDDDEGDEDGKKKKRTSSRGDEDDEPIDEVEDGNPPPRTPHSANRAAVRVDFGVSLSRRQLTFSSRPFEEAPKTYANNPVPGGRVEADIYPLAFSKPDSFASGVGIGGEFDQTIVLNLQSTVQPGTKFPVKQSHFSVGGRLRLVFGKKPTSPSVILKGGYTARQFKVDRGALMAGNVIDLPDVGYKGFTGGLELRVPIGPVALFAGGNGIFVTTTGAIQTREQYGQAKVTGAEARAGLDIAIGKRMAVKAMGEFTQMGFAFTGTGEMSNNRDGDPGSKDVGGAADRYIGGSLLFGVLY